MPNINIFRLLLELKECNSNRYFLPPENNGIPIIYTIGKIEKKYLIDCIQFTLFVSDMLFR